MVLYFKQVKPCLTKLNDDADFDVRYFASEASTGKQIQNFNCKTKSQFEDTPAENVLPPYEISLEFSELLIAFLGKYITSYNQIFTDII